MATFALELGGLLSGGGLVGAAGVAWMVSSGCWPYFIETATNWNPGYFAAGRKNWTVPRLIATVLRLSPWYGLLIVAAVSVMRRIVVGTLRVPFLSITDPQPSTDGTRSVPTTIVTALLAAAYVGWLVQSFGFQHLFDYIHAPAVMLSFLLLATCTASQLAPRESQGANWPRVAWAAFALLALCWSPLVQPPRLQLWTVCVRGPVTPAVRDQLSHFHNPNRQDLARVAAFLRQQGVSGQEVCFYNSDFVGMYRHMGLTPPTRYTYFYELIRYLPNHHDDLLHGLTETPHRFVVTDVITTGIKAERVDRLGPNGSLKDAKAQPKHWSRGYPWSCPVVFRAGTYLVHRVDGPIEALSLPNAMLKPQARDANEVVATQ